MALTETTTVPERIKRIKLPSLAKNEWAAVLEELRELCVCVDCPRIEGFDVAAYSHPARHLGGDYFDFISLNDHRLAIVVADVVGKGTGSAVVMSMVRNALHACAAQRTGPAEILHELNDFVFRYTRPEVFVTMLLAVLDVNRRILALCRAGHEGLLYLPSGNGACRIVSPDGIALGMDDGDLFFKTLQQEEIPLALGDTLLFYTDGVTEAVNPQGESFSLERLRITVQEAKSTSAGGLLGHISRSMAGFTGSASQSDDQTLVSVRVQNSSPEAELCNAEQ